MEFIAIDVETANADIASICSIGLVHFADGQVVAAKGILVNPQDHFDEVNIRIHGIRPEDVASAPKIEQVYPQLASMLDPSIVVHHTHFDRTAFHKLTLKHQLPDLTCRWLDSSSIARRAWPDCARKGYGLADLARKLNIQFKHHDATEDARAAGEVVVRAITATGIGLDKWLTLVSQPNRPSPSDDYNYEGHVARDGNPKGPLYGEVIAFTGKLSIERERAARLAAMAGCKVTDGVTKKTSLLVVGDQDARLLNGHDKSAKHRKAEKLIADGAHIKILTESDFILLLEHVVAVARLTHAEN
jgi:DNA polymerase-3 subunit epsilon